MDNAPLSPPSAGRASDDHTPGQWQSGDEPPIALTNKSNSAGRRNSPARLLKEGSLTRRILAIAHFVKRIIYSTTVWVVPPAVFSFLLGFLLWLSTMRAGQRWYRRPPSEWWQQWQTLLIILTILPFVIYAFWRIPKRQLARLASKIDRNDYRGLEPKDRIQLEKDLAKLESDIRLTLAQTFAGALILLGLYFTAENLRVTQNSATATAITSEANVKVAQDRLISERFTQAVQQLGKFDQPNENNLAMRLGAIQSLEQLAWLPTIQRVDAPRLEGPAVPIKTATGTAVGVLTYHEPVMRILAAFFRANASYPAYHRAVDRANKAGEELSWPPTDLSEILKVLGRRQITNEPRSIYKQRVDLSRCFIGRASLFEANLEGADLTGANLSGADLRGAKLMYALLEGVDFLGASLQGADFTGAEGVDWDYVKSVAIVNETTIPPTGPPPK